VITLAKSKYSKYVITELKKFNSPEQIARYGKFAKRIRWIDEDVIPGAFQMNTAWYFAPQPKGPGQHYHEVSEIIGFIGSDFNNPDDLGAKIEFWIEDEQFILDKSCMIFIPPNMKHCPLNVLSVDRPLFHFTTVPHGKYEIKGMKKQ
jgi:hypothetical protein